MLTKHILKKTGKIVAIVAICTISCLSIFSYAIAGEPLRRRNRADSPGPSIPFERLQNARDELSQEVGRMHFRLGQNASSIIDIGDSLQEAAEINSLSDFMRLFPEIHAELICMGKELYDMYSNTDIQETLCASLVYYIKYSDIALLSNQPEDHITLFNITTAYTSQLSEIVRSINLYNNIQDGVHLARPPQALNSGIEDPSNNDQDDSTNENSSLDDGRRGEGPYFSVENSSGADPGAAIDTNNAFASADENNSNSEEPLSSSSIDNTDTLSSTNPTQKQVLFALWPKTSYNYASSTNLSENSELAIEEFIANFTELVNGVNNLKKDFLLSTTTASKEKFDSLDMTKIRNFSGTLNPQISYESLLSYLSGDGLESVSLENNLLSSLRPLSKTPGNDISLKNSIEAASLESEALNEVRIYKMARKVYETDLYDKSDAFQEGMDNIKENIKGPIIVKTKKAMTGLICVKDSSR